MRTAAIKITMLAALTGCAAFAQNSDFAILYGISPHKSEALASYQLSYARQVLDTRAGGLYVELPVFTVSNAIANGAGSILFTPGVRFKFATQSRLSPYAVLGVGVASFGGSAVASRTTTSAVDFGAGMDVRLTRLLSIRGEVRDFVTRPRLGDYGGRNHPVFGVGIAFHF
jgi:hypothetical protein